MIGDETDTEINDASNVMVQALEYLRNRWPELRPVFETEPRRLRSITMSGKRTPE